MATEIKSIPVLDGKVAEGFIKNAEANVKKKQTIDFSKQVAKANKILANAKI